VAKTFNIDQFADTTKQFLSTVVRDLPDINARVAVTALSILTDRIWNEGLAGSYSTNQIPFFFRKNGKLLAPYSSGAISGGAETKVESAKRKGKKTLSYKEWREFNGLQSDHIDLKFSGDMWRDIGVVSSELQGTTVVTVVTAKNTITRKGGQKTEDIMSFNAERYGDFMALTPEEEEKLAKAFDKELQNIINQTFE
jgi:hypothetical protein